MSHPVCLALDIGHKRIGLAVGALVPFGRGTLQILDQGQAVAAIKQLIEDEGVERIVIGLPEVKSGDTTESARLAQEFSQMLRQAVNLPISFVNEAYTSVEAERQLRAEGVDTQQEKARIDERSAILILEQYLNEGKNTYS